MNAYTSKEELALLPANRISYPEHYTAAREARSSLVLRVIAAIRDHFARQRVLAELNSLSDRELSDIGLNRGELPLVFQPVFAGRRA